MNKMTTPATDGIQEWLAEESLVDESVSIQEIGAAVQALLVAMYDADSLDPVRDKILALHQRLFPGKWIRSETGEPEPQAADDIPAPKPAAVLDWLLFEITANPRDPEIVSQKASDARRMLQDITEIYNIPI